EKVRLDAQKTIKSGSAAFSPAGSVGASVTNAAEIATSDTRPCAVQEIAFCKRSLFFSVTGH
ncbi:MAG: hypothetical protein IJS90_05685, partial [Clostridia bacterium]|nr:hypothetical protein [Clostridia bacterium]